MSTCLLIKDLQLKLKRQIEICNVFQLTYSIVNIIKCSNQNWNVKVQLLRNKCKNKKEENMKYIFVFKIRENQPCLLNHLERKLNKMTFFCFHSARHPSKFMRECKSLWHINLLLLRQEIFTSVIKTALTHKL